MSSSEADALNQSIREKTALLKTLREHGTDPSIIDAAHKELGDLKRALGQLSAAAKERDKADGKKKDRLLLKTPKGTRDFGPAETACRSHIESIIKDVFTSFGGTGLDTPVFERKDILAGKYGEDAKLIFDLADQGGEQLALRYDHTVPLARHLASSLPSSASTSFKLFQFGKVYRRDNPVVSKGRMREFSQADFDITGVWDLMVPDAEVISLLSTVLSRLDVGEYTIKLNHRKILDGLFQVCGVPDDKIRSISSAVDKLDKLPWSEVRKEMTDEKGLDPAVADKIGEYVKLKGGPELLRTLEADAALTSNARSKEGILEMGILFRLLDAYQVTQYISFDLSLARGLDYYTGIIYEAIVEASAPPGFKPSAQATPATSSSKPQSTPKPQLDDEGEPEVDESTVGIGSIAAGGRYDNLVQLFTSAAAGEGKAGKKAPGLPCVGVSIGLDRVFALTWPKWVERGGRSKETAAYVMAAGDGLLEERVALVRELREAGIKTDFLFKNKPKLSAQFTAGEKDEVPFAIILGADELREGLVTVKEQIWEVVDGKRTKVENDSKGVTVKRDELVGWLKAQSIPRQAPSPMSLSQPTASRGCILLIGSGPGHPSLLTLAASCALRTADVVFSDKLVPEGVLQEIPKHVELHIAQKSPGHTDKAQEDLMHAAVAAAQQGKVVVRLKQGDPMLYARALSEIKYFTEHGFPPTVLPGLSSALAAPLAAGIPVTSRGVAGSVVICTGVGQGGREGRVPAYERATTLLVMMSVARVAEITRGMVQDGYPAYLPACVIERATMPDQRVVRSTLGGIAEAMSHPRVVPQRPPGIMVVGWACLGVAEGVEGVSDDMGDGLRERDLARVDGWLGGEGFVVREGLDEGWRNI